MQKYIWKKGMQLKINLKFIGNILGSNYLKQVMLYVTSFKNNKNKTPYLIS